MGGGGGGGRGGLFVLGHAVGVLAFLHFAELGVPECGVDCELLLCESGGFPLLFYKYSNLIHGIISYPFGTDYQQKNKIIPVRDYIKICD